MPTSDAHLRELRRIALRDEWAIGVRVAAHLPAVRDLLGVATLPEPGLSVWAHECPARGTVASRVMTDVPNEISISIPPGRSGY